MFMLFIETVAVIVGIFTVLLCFRCSYLFIHEINDVRKTKRELATTSNRTTKYHRNLDRELKMAEDHAEHLEKMLVKARKASLERASYPRLCEDRREHEASLRQELESAYAALDALKAERDEDVLDLPYPTESYLQK